MSRTLPDQPGLMDPGVFAATPTRVAEVMTREVVTATLDDRVERCLEKMRSVGCRHLPVVADGRVIAMISMRDLMRDEIEEQVEEIRGLREYIHQA